MLHRFAEGLARALAIAGGCILILVTGLTCLSIIGRALVPLDIGIGPIRGIYDMTEMGMAAAVFAFLPLAQFRETHARVDLFAQAIPRRAGLILDVLFNGFMLVLASVISWRLYLGLLDKYSYGETTLIAQIPVWQGYAVSMVGAIGFVLVSAFCVVRAIRRLFYSEAV